MSDARRRLTRFVAAATKVEPHELKATVVSFVFVFCLMAAYFIMRPARDALGHADRLGHGISRARTDRTDDR